MTFCYSCTNTVNYGKKKSLFSLKKKKKNTALVRMYRRVVGVWGQTNFPLSKTPSSSSSSSSSTPSLYCISISRVIRFCKSLTADSYTANHLRLLLWSPLVNRISMLDHTVSSIIQRKKKQHRERKTNTVNLVNKQQIQHVSWSQQGEKNDTHTLRGKCQYINKHGVHLFL